MGVCGVYLYKRVRMFVEDRVRELEFELWDIKERGRMREFGMNINDMYRESWIRRELFELRGGKWVKGSEYKFRNNGKK